MQHLEYVSEERFTFQITSILILAQVRFLAYHRIKPHAPPLVRTPVNSFEFHRCRRTPQVVYLSLSLRHSPQRANSKSTSFRAWTTRVSNPVCSPRFRASASIKAQQAAFAIGVLWHIYAFHRYMPHSACLNPIQVSQYQSQLHGLSPAISRLTYKTAYAPFKPSDSG